MGLQEPRVATREESGVLGLPSRRGLTPRPQSVPPSPPALLPASPKGWLQQGPVDPPLQLSLYLGGLFQKEIFELLTTRFSFLHCRWKSLLQRNIVIA